jgi:hypothetical protein
MALGAEAILKHAGTLRTKVVHVPAWVDADGDDAVIVRGMTVREFELNQAKLGDEDGHATAGLVARCVLSENGQRVFTDAQVPQIAELGFAEVNRIGQAISELSGLTEEAQEEIAGNSEAAQSGKPSSGSPETSDAPSQSLRTA